MVVKHAIDENKTQTIHKRITDSNGDLKKLFNIIKILWGRQKKLVLPDYNYQITLASTFNMYFIDKIANIRAVSIAGELITSVLIWMEGFHYAYLCKLT